MIKLFGYTLVKWRHLDHLNNRINLYQLQNKDLLEKLRYTQKWEYYENHNHAYSNGFKNGWAKGKDNAIKKILRGFKEMYNG